MALSKKNDAETMVEETQETAAEVVTSDALEEPTQELEQNVNVPATATPHAPPATTGGGNPAVVNQLAASGFAGLEIDWTSFPTVVLDQGEFGTSDGNSLNTKEITVRLMQSRKRFVLRTNAQDDDDAELAYTYDLSELNDPESELSLKVTKWREEDGLDYTTKEYIEAVAVVEDSDSPLDQQMVLLQIPPTSVGRFSGFTTQNLLIKREEPSQYLTRCYAGDKVTKAKKPFTPWAFERKEG